MRTIYHVQLKNTWPYKANSYFGSLAAIFKNNQVKKSINVSIHTLYKHDFDEDYFQNDYCYIFKSFLNKV